MTSRTNHVLESTAIVLACLLAVSVLVRSHSDGVASSGGRDHLFTSRPTRAEISAVAPATVRDPDEIRTLLKDMALHD